MSRPQLLYIGDAMCSWCWGFAPILDRIVENYGDRLEIGLIVGGLRPGTRNAMTKSMKDEVLHHWKEVHKLTGQPFCFEFNLPDDFRYDTEPAARAAVAVRELAPERALGFITSAQQAFYAENCDVTDTGVLADLAETTGVDREDFLKAFESEETTRATWADFARAQGYGVTGFPSIILEGTDVRPALLTFGYQPYEVLQPRLDQWLAAQASS